MPPPIAQQLTFIYADDLQTCADFYGDVLELDLVLDQGICRIFRVAGEAFLGVCGRRPGRSVSRDGVVVTFVTGDVDGWHARLVTHGTEILAPPKHSSQFDIDGFFARDPAGHLIEFQRFNDPAWPAPGT